MTTERAELESFTPQQLALHIQRLEGRIVRLKQDMEATENPDNWSAIARQTKKAGAELKLATKVFALDHPDHLDLLG